LVLPTLESLDVSGATILVRADLNVPLDDGVIGDDFRIRSSIPTLTELRSRGAKLVVCSHLGRPKGEDPSLSMAPVAQRLGELGGFPTILAPGVAGDAVNATISGADDGSVVVLENTRFALGETSNDADLAAAMAQPIDAFVLDAFGSAHRAHASTVGVAQLVPSAAGLLLQKEVDALSALLGDADRPYVVVLGGAKVSDKLAVIENLLPRVDLMLVGGGMCFTLLSARGYEIGSSLVEEDMLPVVERLLGGDHGGKIVLPEDIVVADRFAEDAATSIVDADAIPDDVMGLDIGPRTIEQFSGVIRSAHSLFWNGPMGVFEWEAFRAGTAGVADAVASCDGFTVVGGGDSVAAIRLLGREDDVSHVSSGGGAGLELLEGRDLPGVAALRRWL
jgi:phosphoglycerate kinase